MRALITATFLSSFFILMIGCGQSSTDSEVSSTEGAFLKHISAQEFKTQMETQPGILLDVRTPGEFASGHLKNATLIDFNGDNFSAEISRQKDKDQVYYVYCGSGIRSARAAELMKSKGFTKIYDMKGGIAQWQRAGFEVTK